MAQLNPFGMSDMRNALSEPGSVLSGEAEPDEKTVEILVVMHGEDRVFSEEVGLIPCETYLTQAGVCGVAGESPSTQLERVASYKSVTKELRPSVHNVYHGKHVEELQSHIPSHLRSSVEGVSPFQQTSRGQLNALAHQYLQLDKTLKPTSLEVDRIYSDDLSVELSAVLGIFIVGTNFFPHITRKVHVNTTITPEMTAYLKAHFDSMRVKTSSFETFAKEVIELQSLNILNVSVLNELTRSILGQPLDLRTLDTASMGPFGEKIQISTNGTGIPHYTNVKLSHLRKLFGLLGFNKVVNFDDACRLANPTQTFYRREQEKEAQEFEEGASTPRWKPGSGGRTRRSFKKQKQTKRKRSRRFHKKS